MEFLKRCWAEVSIDNLISNLNLIKNQTTGEVICVVKANAYGHGDVSVVKALESAGVKYFAVASVNEAIHLRNNGCTGEILLLGGYLSDCFESALDYDITLALYDTDIARQYSDFAVKNGRCAKVHIKLNTGMSRIGFCCDTDKCCIDTANEIEKISHLKGIKICGAFTHFSVSDEQDGNDYTTEQIRLFKKQKQLLCEKGIDIPFWHCANSGAIVNYSDDSFDAVRAGIILYGLYNGYGAPCGYKPVMSLKSVITQIRPIQKNVSVSYGRTFVSDKDMVTATVSIGYADGYPRSMSNGGTVLVNGKRASVIGRVCMDQIIIDITGIDCKVGDTVTVFGKDGSENISVDYIAKKDSTINYEIICRISPRVPRVYIKDGKPVGITEYI